MKIAVGADHAGFPLKEIVIAILEHNGHEAIDLGTSSSESVDYPDYAEKVARMGVKVISACCGSTPAHIRAMAERLENYME